MFLTIPDFEQLTKTQMFNMAFNHIMSTKKPSIDNGGTCIYSGSGCNAAPFLTEEGRKIGDENSIKNAAGGWEDLASSGLVPYHNADFVSELQAVHDSAALSITSDFMELYVKGMNRLAVKHKIPFEMPN